MKVLILSPYLHKPGGVAVYFSAVKDHFDSDYEFFFRGNKTTNKSSTVIFKYFLDYIKFIFTLIRKKHDIYLVNTSFAQTGCSRDQVYIVLLKLLNRKVVVFFRGWNKDYEIKVDQLKLKNQFPLEAFKKADAIIVLASEFKNKLISWGFSQEIYLETTTVDSHLTNELKIKEFDIKNIPSPLIFLFMARIELGKGIIEAADFFQAIQQELPHQNFKFKFAGDGSAIDELKKYVKEKEIENIDFLGYITGQEKKNALENSHIFLFPTKYGEGMPNCLLEAMAFGLPLITTTVGGIKDFFEEGKMGIEIKPNTITSPESLKKVMNLILNPSTLQRISRNNYEYAKSRFFSENVAARLEGILYKTIEDGKSI